MSGEMEKESIYLDYTRHADGHLTCHPHSIITLFVLRFCETDHFKIHMVLQEGCEWPFSQTSLEGLTHEYVEQGALPACVSKCIRPVVRCSDSVVILSGLGSILRYISKIVNKYSKRDLITELLGYKGGCLGCCAETSVWTKFCEVELPNAELHQDTALKQRDGQLEISIPAEVMRVENHFFQPAKIHNIDKRRKLANETFKKLGLEFPLNIEQCNVAQDLLIKNDIISGVSLSTKLDAQKKKILHRFEETDGFQHRFVEGTDFTLADIVFFLFASKLLVEWQDYIPTIMNHLPNICEWYARMLMKTAVMKAAQLCNIITAQLHTTSNADQTQVSVVMPPDMGIVLNIRDPNKKKFRAPVVELNKTMNKLEECGISPTVGEHPSEDVSLPWEQMHVGVHPSEGDLPKSRVQRKCQQLESLVAAVQWVTEPGATVIDFCAGGGHVGILVAYLMPECKVILVENKEESVRRAKLRIERLQLTNITIYQCNLDYFCGHFDVGVCLHACGVATDLVLDTCVNKNAAFVICPCCYGKIQDTHTMTYPRSSKFKHQNITYQDLLTVGHAADGTDFSLEEMHKIGKQCMNLIDTDRSSLAEEHGYMVTLCSLKPLTCSPKNNLLIGRPSPP